MYYETILEATRFCKISVLMCVRHCVPALRGKEARQATLTAKSTKGWRYLCDMYVEDLLLRDRTLREKKQRNVRLNFCPCQRKCTTLYITNNCTQYCPTSCITMIHPTADVAHVSSDIEKTCLFTKLCLLLMCVKEMHQCKS